MAKIEKFSPAREYVIHNSDLNTEGNLAFITSNANTLAEFKQDLVKEGIPFNNMKITVAESGHSLDLDEALMPDEGATIFFSQISNEKGSWDIEKVSVPTIKDGIKLLKKNARGKVKKDKAAEHFTNTRSTKKLREQVVEWCAKYKTDKKYFEEDTIDISKVESTPPAKRTKKKTTTDLVFAFTDDAYLNGLEHCIVNAPDEVSRQTMIRQKTIHLMKSGKLADAVKQFTKNEQVNDVIKSATQKFKSLKITRGRRF